MFRVGTTKEKGAYNFLREEGCRFRFVSICPTMMLRCKGVGLVLDISGSLGSKLRRKSRRHECNTCQKSIICCFLSGEDYRADAAADPQHDHAFFAKLVSEWAPEWCVPQRLHELRGCPRLCGAACKSNGRLGRQWPIHEFGTQLALE